MRFFVDTADSAEIRDRAATRRGDGVTTKLSLIAQSGHDFEDAIGAIRGLVPGPGKRAAQ